jgi:2-dehydro-3-deoxygluconokinase
MVELQGAAFGAMQQSFGGDTLNTAVYLARCAPTVQVSYATALGDDPYSAGMLARWQAERIDTRLVRHLPGRVPGLYAIAVDAEGERTFTYWRENAAVRAYFDLPQDQLTPLEKAAASLDMLYFSGISLAILSSTARDRLFVAARTVRRHGGRVVFDNNYRPRLWPDVPTAIAAYDEAFSLSDIALITLDDGQALYGDYDENAAMARALALPCPELVIKRGRHPTLVRAPAVAAVEVATLPVPKVVDTTAAGDSFAGAYLAARLAGEGPAAAAAAGNRLAAQVIQHRGAIIARELISG